MAARSSLVLRRGAWLPIRAPARCLRGTVACGMLTAESWTLVVAHDPRESRVRARHGFRGALVVVCPRCYFKNPDGEAACWICGAELEEAEQEARAAEERRHEVQRLNLQARWTHDAALGWVVWCGYVGFLAVLLHLLPFRASGYAVFCVLSGAAFGAPIAYFMSRWRSGLATGMALGAAASLMNHLIIALLRDDPVLSLRFVLYALAAGLLPGVVIAVAVESSDVGESSILQELSGFDCRFRHVRDINFTDPVSRIAPAILPSGSSGLLASAAIASRPVFEHSARSKGIHCTIARARYTTARSVCHFPGREVSHDRAWW